MWRGPPLQCGVCRTNLSKDRLPPSRTFSQVNSCSKYGPRQPDGKRLRGPGKRLVALQRIPEPAEVTRMLVIGGVVVPGIHGLRIV